LGKSENDVKQGIMCVLSKVVFKQEEYTLAWLVCHTEETRNDTMEAHRNPF